MTITIEQFKIFLSSNSEIFLLTTLLLWIYICVILEFFATILLRKSLKSPIVKITETLLWGAMCISISFVDKSVWVITGFLAITVLKLLKQFLSTLKLFEIWGNVELYLANVLRVIFNIVEKAIIERIESMVIMKMNDKKINNDKNK